jgi:hypothetical protein
MLELLLENSRQWNGRTFSVVNSPQPRLLQLSKKSLDVYARAETKPFWFSHDLRQSQLPISIGT